MADIIPIKPGFILIEVKKRKKGLLLIYKRFGIPKTKDWRLQIERNEYEKKNHFKQRKAEFYSIIMEIFNQYKSDTNPPTSDSRI